MTDLPKLPFIAWNRQADGSIRPRFKPSQAERKLGFPGCDLRHENRGPWFTFAEVNEWLYGADGRSGRYAAILKQRKIGKPLKAPQRVAGEGRTVEALIVDWLADIDWREKPEGRPDDGLEASSLVSYTKDANALIWRPSTTLSERQQPNPPASLKEPFVLMPLGDIGVPELDAHFKYLRKVRGHHAALHAIAAFSAAWQWGQRSTKWRLGLNPRHQIEFKRPDGRISIIEAEGIAALVAVADAAGCPSVGDAVLLGLFTGQRQNDRLALEDSGLIDGRRRFRQNKTGVIVEIKETPRLAQRLAEAAARRRAGVATIIVDELSGVAYGANAYRHRFEDVRAVAIHGWRVGESFPQARRRAELEGKRIAANDIAGVNILWRVAPCAALAYSDKGEWDPKRDQDLRDTCVTLLYRAGCTLHEICDITGHSYQAVKTIRDHYLARDRASADAAIDKLIAYMEAKGMAV